MKQQSTIEGNATTSSFNIQHLPLLLSITHQLLITPTHDEVATNQPHVGYIICKHQAVTPFSSTADASTRKVGKDNQDLVANNIHNGAHSYVVGSIYFHVCGILIPYLMQQLYNIHHDLHLVNDTGDGNGQQPTICIDMLLQHYLLT